MTLAGDFGVNVQPDGLRGTSGGNLVWIVCAYRFIGWSVVIAWNYWMWWRDKGYRPGRRILLYRQNGRGTVTCLQDRGHSFKHYGSWGWMAGDSHPGCAGFFPRRHSVKVVWYPRGESDRYLCCFYIQYGLHTCQGWGFWTGHPCAGNSRIRDRVISA